eukprot:Rmarinus@m.26301
MMMLARRRLAPLGFRSLQTSGLDDDCLLDALTDAARAVINSREVLLGDITPTSVCLGLWGMYERTRKRRMLDPLQTHRSLKQRPRPDRDHLLELSHFARIAELSYAKDEGEVYRGAAEIGLSVIYAKTTSYPRRPAHFVAFDKEKKLGVISIRGTKEAADMIINATMRPSRFPGGGLVHAGIRSAAEWVESRAGDIVQHLMWDQGYRVVIVGHSMGAGAAALVSVLLHQRLNRGHHSETAEALAQILPGDSLQPKPHSGDHFLPNRMDHNHAAKADIDPSHHTHFHHRHTHTHTHHGDGSPHFPLADSAPSDTPLFSHTKHSQELMSRADTPPPMHQLLDSEHNGPSLHCFAFATPSCMDRELSLRCELAGVTSVVLNDDVVPRLSTDGLKWFRDDLTDAASKLVKDLRSSAQCAVSQKTYAGDAAKFMGYLEHVLQPRDFLPDVSRRRLQELVSFIDGMKRLSHDNVSGLSSRLLSVRQSLLTFNISMPAVLSDSLWSLNTLTSSISSSLNYIVPSPSANVSYPYAPPPDGATAAPPPSNRVTISVHTDTSLLNSAGTRALTPVDSTQDLRAITPAPPNALAVNQDPAGLDPSLASRIPGKVLHVYPKYQNSLESKDDVDWRCAYVDFEEYESLARISVSRTMFQDHSCLRIAASLEEAAKKVPRQPKT